MTAASEKTRHEPLSELGVSSGKITQHQTSATRRALKADRSEIVEGSNDNSEKIRCLCARENIAPDKREAGGGKRGKSVMACIE